jgi:hypothetical protein
MRFRPANIRMINRRQNLPRLLLALSLKDDTNEDNDKNNPTDVQKLTGHSISVLRRLLDVIDHHHIYRPFARLELQPQLLLQSCKERRT